MKILDNKKGQLSDVLTWIVATLVIVGVLIIFIYGSSLLAQKNKVVEFDKINLELDSDSGSLIELKNSLTYELASEEQRTIIDDYFEMPSEVEDEN